MNYKALSAVIIAATLSINAFGLTQEKGVVKSVNLEENTIAIASKNGRVHEFKLSDSAKVYGADSIKEGQEVTLKISGLKKEEKIRYIPAEILSVNAESGTAVVREERSGDVRTVTFTKDVVVKGRAHSVAELSKGHLIRVRYTAQ